MCRILLIDVIVIGIDRVRGKPYSLVANEHYSLFLYLNYNLVTEKDPSSTNAWFPPASELSNVEVIVLV